MIKLREAKIKDLSTLLEFEKSLIEYERAFTPNLKKSDFNYYDLKSYIKNPEISVVVAEKEKSLIASGYALIRSNKTYKNPSHIVFLGFMYGSIPFFILNEFILSKSSFSIKISPRI